MLMTSRNARTRRQQRGRGGRIKTGPQAQLLVAKNRPELPIACSTEPAYSQEVQEKIHRQAAKKNLGVIVSNVASAAILPLKGLLTGSFSPSLLTRIEAVPSPAEALQ